MRRIGLSNGKQLSLCVLEEQLAKKRGLHIWSCSCGAGFLTVFYSLYHIEKCHPGANFEDHIKLKDDIVKIRSIWELLYEELSENIYNAIGPKNTNEETPEVVDLTNSPPASPGAVTKLKANQTSLVTAVENGEPDTKIRETAEKMITDTFSTVKDACLEKFLNCGKIMVIVQYLTFSVPLRKEIEPSTNILDVTTSPPTSSVAVTNKLPANQTSVVNAVKAGEPETEVNETVENKKAGVFAIKEVSPPKNKSDPSNEVVDLTTTSSASPVAVTSQLSSRESSPLLVIDESERIEAISTYELSCNVSPPIETIEFAKKTPKKAERKRKVDESETEEGPLSPPLKRYSADEDELPERFLVLSPMFSSVQEVFQQESPDDGSKEASMSPKRCRKDPETPLNDKAEEAMEMPWESEEVDNDELFSVQPRRSTDQPYTVNEVFATTNLSTPAIKVNIPNKLCLTPNQPSLSPIPNFQAKTSSRNSETTQEPNTQSPFLLAHASSDILTKNQKQLEACTSKSTSNRAESGGKRNNLKKKHNLSCSVESTKLPGTRRPAVVPRPAWPMVPGFRSPIPHPSHFPYPDFTMTHRPETLYRWDGSPTLILLEQWQTFYDLVMTTGQDPYAVRSEWMQQHCRNFYFP